MKTKTNMLKKFKSLDFFGHGVSFLVHGKDKSQSSFGAIVSLLSAVLVGAYFAYLFQLMVGYQNTQVSYILNENVFSDTEIVQNPKERLGFNIAFGIIDIFTYKAPEGIEKTGFIKARNFSYNVDKIDRGEIPIHKCTLEDKKKFYEPN
jgi:hypothetical protein